MTRLAQSTVNPQLNRSYVEWPEVVPYPTAGIAGDRRIRFPTEDP